MAAGMCSCLMMGTLWGCSEKEVDYVMDTEDPQEELTGSLNQFEELEKWDETWELTLADGQKADVDINASVTVPEGDAMSVVEVEKITVDAAFKEQILTAFFGETDVYYHDSQNSDTDVVAEDLSVCNQYLGYRDSVPYYVNFAEDGDPAVEIGVGLSASDPESLYGRPNVLMDKQEAICFSIGEIDGDNLCSVDEEEAKEQAERFLHEAGFANQVFLNSESICWYGWDLDEENQQIDDVQVLDGYCFYYSIGVDGIAFRTYGTGMDYSGGSDSSMLFDIEEIEDDLCDWVEIWVNDSGITGVRIEYPVTVTRVTNQVKLMPLASIQEIMKGEVMEHADRYHFDEYTNMTSMELIYFRVRDVDTEGSYSYVPTWRLSRFSYNNPVLVNAIDGSVIYLEDELGGWK